MPEKKTIERARAAKRAGKSSSTQAGAFVKEQIDHIREGKHGAKSAKQAIAIGLSEARKEGGKVPPAKKASAKEKDENVREDLAILDKTFHLQFRHGEVRPARSASPRARRRGRLRLRRRDRPSCRAATRRSQSPGRRRSRPQ